MSDEASGSVLPVSSLYSNVGRDRGDTCTPHLLASDSPKTNSRPTHLPAVDTQRHQYLPVTTYDVRLYGAMGFLPLLERFDFAWPANGSVNLADKGSSVIKTPEPASAVESCGPD
ncbi:unnamed protein product, partial [Iphiclides podalirius]